MSALIIFAVVVLWAGLGFVLWKFLVRPRVRNAALLWLITAGLALLWFVGPVADEILGAREFKRLCDEMPSREFHGPISVGPGRLFDADGTPTWKTESDLQNISFAEWHRIFAKREETRRIRTWPVPVFERVVRYTLAETGKEVLVVRWRGSPGGWIKQALRWGSHAPYQCVKDVGHPPRKDWIKF